MRRLARTSMLLVLVALLIAAFPVTGLAAEEEGEGGAGSSTTTTAPVDSGLEPAVDVTVDTTPPPQPDWTYRYMVPTALVLAAVIVLVTAIRYFTDVVRKRYRIIEE